MFLKPCWARGRGLRSREVRHPTLQLLLHLLELKLVLFERFTLKVIVVSEVTGASE
jgi:hypothetical protein